MPSPRRRPRRHQNLRRRLQPQQRRLRPHRLKPRHLHRARQTSHNPQPHLRPRSQTRSLRPRLFLHPNPALHRKDLPHSHQPTTDPQ